MYSRFGRSFHRLSQFRCAFFTLSRLWHFLLVIVSVLFWLRVFLFSGFDLSSAPKYRASEKHHQIRPIRFAVALRAFTTSATESVQCLLNYSVLIASFSGWPFRLCRSACFVCILTFRPLNNRMPFSMLNKNAKIFTFLLKQVQRYCLLTKRHVANRWNAIVKLLPRRCFKYN